MRVFLSNLPSTFDHAHADQWFAAFEVRHTMQARVSEPEIIYLYFVVVFLIAFSSSSFVFMQFLRGIFNLPASSNSDVLLIYY